jgi:hypothetical protein
MVIGIQLLVGIAERQKEKISIRTFRILHSALVARWVLVTNVLTMLKPKPELSLVAPN